MKNIYVTQDEYDEIYDMLDKAYEELENADEDTKKEVLYVPSPEEVTEGLDGNGRDYLRYLLYIDEYVDETPENKESKKFINKVLREHLVITD